MRREEATASEVPPAKAWVLVAAASGLGKRSAGENQFRLQRRARLGLGRSISGAAAIEVVGLEVLGAGVELLLISERA